MTDTPFDENFTPQFGLESGGNLATVVTNTANLSTIVTNTNGLATQTTAAASKADLDTIVTNTNGLATQTTAAASKADLDTIVTNTTGSATVAAQTTGNTSLSTIATNTGNIPTKETFSTTISGSAQETYLYSSGTPDSTGLPQQPFFTRKKGLQGKATNAGTITSTLAGDTNVVFSVAPKALQPGQQIRLQGATVEAAFVSDSYTPSASTTTVPIKNALVNAGNTTATWEIFNEGGAQANAMLAYGVDPVAPIMFDASSGGNPTYRLNACASQDALSGKSVLGVNNMTYNGTNNDRFRGNLDNISLVASAAYTTTQTSADQTNFNGRGLIVVLNMTNVGASPSVTLEIDGKDPVSGTYYPLLTGVAILTVSTNVYTVYPGTTAVTNVTSNMPLPRTWRVKVTANNANSGTYSVGASVIL